MANREVRQIEAEARREDLSEIVGLTVAGLLVGYAAYRFVQWTRQPVVVVPAPAPPTFAAPAFAAPAPSGATQLTQFLDQYRPIVRFQ